MAHHEDELSDRHELAIACMIVTCVFVWAGFIVVNGAFKVWQMFVRLVG